MATKFDPKNTLAGPGRSGYWLVLTALASKKACSTFFGMILYWIDGSKSIMPTVTLCSLPSVGMLLGLIISKEVVIPES